LYVRVLLLSLIAGLFFMHSSHGHAEEVLKTASENKVASPDASGSSAKTATKDGNVMSALIINKAAVKSIELKQTETATQIKEVAKQTDQTKLAMQKMSQEQQVLEKVAETKTQEATAVKAEAKAAMSEAIKTGDSEAKRKAQDLNQEASQLAGEAVAAKEKAKALELKSQANEQKVLANIAAIDAMRNEMLDLRKERQAQRGLIDKLGYGGIVILIGLFLFWLLHFVLKRFELFVSDKDALRESERTLRIKTLTTLFKWLGSIIILGIVVYMFFENFGIDMSPFLAGAGIIGLAFGFGGQYLIRDIINGIFILIEGQYRINDVVKIGETGGLVEAINLRVTKLRDLEGRVIYIPNGEVKTVINFTQDFAQALLNIGVAYKENVDHVMEVIKGVAKEMRGNAYFGKLILAELEMLGVDDFADSQVTIKCRFKTLPIKQWEVAREFRRRIKNKFDELGIEIPFPHRTLYLGTGADNRWLKNVIGEKNSGPDELQTNVKT